jgi:hypothetical protein
MNRKDNSPLDTGEKTGMMTDEELEETGVAYGSGQRYETALRETAARLSGAGYGSRRLIRRLLLRQGALREGHPAGSGRYSPGIKRINIVGRKVNSPGDAARLFSAFRNPRIEIFNILYASAAGEVLAHTAWTLGLPSAVRAVDGRDAGEAWQRIRGTMDGLGAQTLWIAHNHPSGNVQASSEDMAVTGFYQSAFGDAFGGHIITDHDRYNYITNGKEQFFPFTPHLKNFIPPPVENQESIRDSHQVAGAFIKILSRRSDITVLAVLNTRLKIISWNYLDGHAAAADMAKFMRLSGGAYTILLTNSAKSFDALKDMAEENTYGPAAIFLDVIEVDSDRKAGYPVRTLSGPGVNWQRHEAAAHPDVRYLVSNRTHQPHLNFRETAAPSGVEKNTRKESSMSDVKEHTQETAGSADVSEEIIEGRGEPKTPEEVAFLNTLHQRKAIAESLENGKLCCLPGAGGLADTSPAVNIANATRYHGVNLLYLKDFQARGGFPSAEYITRGQIDKARAETNDPIFIRKGEKPVTISFKVQNEGTGEWEQKNVLLYNVAQTTKPWVVKAWAENHVQEREQEKQDFLKGQYGDGYKPSEPTKQKGPGPEIVCSSTEPEKYLGQYLAAVSLGGKFRVSPEQAKEFTANMKAAVFERGANEHTDPYRLPKICRAAGQECREVMRETGQQQQEQEISRGRSR